MTGNIGSTNKLTGCEGFWDNKRASCTVVFRSELPPSTWPKMRSQVSCADAEKDGGLSGSKCGSLPVYGPWAMDTRVFPLIGYRRRIKRRALR